MVALVSAPAQAQAPDRALPERTARKVYELIDTIKRPGTPADLQRSLDALVARGPAITPLVLQEMGKRDRQTFAPMVYVLGRVGNRSTRKVLWDIARREKGVVRHWAHYALAMHGEVSAVREVVRSSSATASFVPGGTAADFVAGVIGPPAVPVLLEELPNRAGPGLLAGLNALGTLGDPRATPFLLTFLDSDDPALQRVALAALARIGAPEAAPPATRLLASEDPLVREAAAEALSYLKWAGALAELRRVATQASGLSLRAKAVWALGKVGGAPAASTLAGIARSESHPQLRRVAVQALGETGSGAAAEPLEALALEGDALAPMAIASLGRLTIPVATRSLARVAQTAPSPVLRRRALEALAEREPDRAAALAVDLLTSLGPSGLEAPETLLTVVARDGGAAALRKLDSIAEGPGLDPLLRPVLAELRARVELGDDLDSWRGLLRSREPRDVLLAVERMGELGDPAAVPDLVESFGRIDPEQVHRVVIALGRIGSPEALPFLRDLVAGDLYDVPSLSKARRAGAWSLARCGGSARDRDVLAAMAERGGREAVQALVSLAVIHGADALPDLYLLKRDILRRVTADAVSAHESINWLISELRAGRTPDRLDRPPE